MKFPVFSALMFGALVAIPSYAIPISNQTFSFTGSCSDCTGTVSGTLVTSGAYVLGTTLTSVNFVSFTYNGSNLLSAFTILPTDPNFEIFGGLPASLPASASLDILSTGKEFDNSTGGFWCAGNGCAGDHGTVGAFAAATSTPEPSTISMLILGFSGLAGVLGRRHKAVSSL